MGVSVSRGPRASWISTELFLTFPCPTLASITLIPSTENAGRFRVWLGNLDNAVDGQENGLNLGEGMVRKENGMVLLWDRKVEGAFPEVSRPAKSCEGASSLWMTNDERDCFE